jgi:archaellum component FlaD/FlaE
MFSVSLKSRKDLNLSKEIVALLTIEDLNSREIENKLNKKVRGHYLCAAATFRK